jgi:hypothetical protein
MKECKIEKGIFRICEFPEQNKEKYPVILMLHGFTGNHIEPSFLFPRFSKVASKIGFATVRFDFKGSGNSDGEFYEMTSKTELNDAQEILNFILSDNRFDKTNIFVLGLSMGGTIALRLVGKNPKRFKGCVLWSAASYNKELFSKSFEEKKSVMPKSEHGYDLGGIEVGEDFISEITSYSAIEESSPFSGPYLLIHGENDPTVPVSMSIKAKEDLKNASLITIPGADHTYRSVIWSKKLFDTTLNFLKNLLK